MAQSQRSKDLSGYSETPRLLIRSVATLLPGRAYRAASASEKPLAPWKLWKGGQCGFGVTLLAAELCPSRVPSCSGVHAGNEVIRAELRVFSDSGTWLGRQEGCDYRRDLTGRQSERTGTRFPGCTFIACQGSRQPAAVIFVSILPG